MATHSSILAWRIPWTEEPGRLQSMGLQRVGHDWATEHKHTAYTRYTRITTKKISLCSGAQSPCLKARRNSRQARNRYWFLVPIKFLKRYSMTTIYALWYIRLSMINYRKKINFQINFFHFPFCLLSNVTDKIIHFCSNYILKMF